MHELSESLLVLASELRKWRKQRKTELEWFKSHFQFATKQDLMEWGNKIMSAISDFAAKQKAFNDRQDSAIAGLIDDVAKLNAKIEELQNTPGTITPEDQALLDDLQKRAEDITVKLEALDAQHPPTPPTA